METKAQDALTQLYNQMRHSYPNVDVIYDTTPMFPPTALTTNINHVSKHDIECAFESLNVTSEIMILRSKNHKDNTELTLSCSKNRKDNPDVHVIHIDSYSMFNNEIDND